MMAIYVGSINPVAFSIFGLPIRWYALAYIAGFVIGYYLFKYLTNKDDSAVKFTNKQYDDILTYIVLGVILGGRLGYVLFYDLHYFIMNPLKIFALWNGGMSFHGGLLGVIIATIIFAYTHKFKDDYAPRNALRILDVLAVVAPIGLGLGRIANFINMELIGRTTNASWGVVFEGVEGVRHPSQLYEATLEGAVLFVIMWLLYTKTQLKKTPGAIGGLLCIFYAIFRIFCEQFRVPDAQIGQNGFLTSWGLTMGQTLSGIMLVVGISIFVWARRKNRK